MTGKLKIWQNGIIGFLEKGQIKVVKQDGKEWLEIVTILKSSGEETVDRFTFDELHNFISKKKKVRA